MDATQVRQRLNRESDLLSQAADTIEKLQAHIRNANVAIELARHNNDHLRAEVAQLRKKMIRMALAGDRLAAAPPRCRPKARKAWTAATGSD